MVCKKDMDALLYFKIEGGPKDQGMWVPLEVGKDKKLVVLQISRVEFSQYVTLILS